MNRTNIVRVVGTCLCVAGVGSSPLLAQQLRLVPEGDTVRVWARGYGLKKTEATVVGWSGATAQFGRLTIPPDSLVVPFGGITRLDHLQGKDRVRGFARGLGIGGGVGVVLGFVVGRLVVGGCQEFLCELDALGYMAGGMVVGAVVGGGIGVSNPPDRWERVTLPVAAGFPPYRTPIHETFAFKLVSTAVGIAVMVLLN